MLTFLLLVAIESTSGIISLSKYFEGSIPTEIGALTNLGKTHSSAYDFLSGEESD